LQSHLGRPDNLPNFVNTKINHLAVWILIVIYFLIGWGWYAIFGEKWLNLHARTMTDIEHTHNVSAYVLAFVASIAVNYALAWMIGRLNATTAIAGLKIGLVCWFAFVFMEYATISVFSAFETNPWPLICIDVGRPLLGFVISGLVLGAWRKH
jgi:predicted transporter